MSQSDGISWTDATWNPIGGCSRASRGCQRCYAERLAGTRLRNHPVYRGTVNKTADGYTFNGTMTIAAPDAGVWSWPQKWRGSSTPRMGVGAPSLIFVGDMSDLFHESRPVEHIDRVFEAMVAALTAGGRRHIFQLLTKRPEVMEKYFRDLFSPRGLAELPYRKRMWLGFSAEDQENFDARWPHMERLARMGFTVFCSYEPALGPVVLPQTFLELGPRAWLIVGGESGRDPRGMVSDWALRVIGQCRDAGVPMHFKQLGTVVARELGLEGKGDDPTAWPSELQIRQFPEIAS